MLISQTAYDRSLAESIIADHYPDLGRFHLAAAGHHRLVAVEAAGRRYVLKRHDPLIAPNAEKLEQVYQACAAKKVVPGFRRTREGSMILAVDGGFFSLQERIVLPPAPVDPFELGLRVAKLHGCLAALPIPSMDNHLQRSVRPIGRLADRYGYSAYGAILNRVERALNDSSPQVIHGDLHPQNLICTRAGYRFIDLDSACVFLPASDVGFAAYRFFGADLRLIALYLLGYNLLSPGRPVTVEDVRNFVIYNILQRILFIHVENGRGDDSHLWDLPNQERYLAQVSKPWTQP